MASDPGNRNGYGGQFDVRLFCRFPREVRDHIYSFVREEPVTVDWIINPEYASPTCVGIEVLNPPCASLLSVPQFKKEYKASLGYTVKANFSDYPLNDLYHHMTMTHNRQHGATKFICHIFKRLKNIMIYVGMRGDPDVLGWVLHDGDCGHLFPDQLYHREHNPIIEYNRVEELLAVIFEYSVPKEHAQEHAEYISHLPRRDSLFFRGLTLPEDPVQVFVTPLRTVTLGIPYHFVTHYQCSTCHPAVDGPNPPVSSLPTYFAGMTLVQQGQGNIFLPCHEENPKEVSEQPSIADITSEDWVEGKVVTLSYSKQGKFGEGIPFPIEEMFRNHALYNDGLWEDDETCIYPFQRHYHAGWHILSEYYRVDKHGDKWTMDKHDNKLSKRVEGEPGPCPYCTRTFQRSP